MWLDSKSPGAIFATIVGSSAIKFLAGFWYARRISNTYEVVGRVAELYCYPIKSFGGIQVESAQLTSLGLSWSGVTDRHFAVATADGVYLTQRQEPSMALISVQIMGDEMQLSAPDMKPITLPTNPPLTSHMLSKVTVKTDTVDSLDCGDEVAAWLCGYFKRDGLRLHFSAPYLDKRECIKNKKNWNHPAKPGDLTALSDYCGYMMLSQASLVALNKRLHSPVPISNFRANIIVNNCIAFAEDNWVSVRIGEAQLRALDSCTRCVMVTVNQTTGVKDPAEEPLSTLKKFRLMEPYGPKPAFGVNLTLDKPGKICVGDVVYAKLGRHNVSPKAV